MKKDGGHLGEHPSIIAITKHVDIATIASNGWIHKLELHAMDGHILVTQNRVQ
jgi:hypothetical protein